MQLPTRSYGQVIEALRKMAENTGSDKRRLSRMEIQTKVQVGVLINGQLRAKFTGLSRDISQGGIGLFHLRPRRTGTADRRRISPPARTSTSWSSAPACSGVVIANGIFGVGAEFTLEANADLIKAWDTFSKTSSSRGSRRRE